MNTPVLLINKQKMMNNIRKMVNISQKNEVNLRPHIKTHKIAYIAEQQIKEGAVGITVATVSEAEVMENHGIKDIFIAFPLVTKSKIIRAIALSKKVRLILTIDSLEGAILLSKMAKKENIILEVRLEIDTGLKRTGVLYQEALKLAEKIVSLQHLELTGIFTFRGALQNGSSTKDIERAGTEEGKLMVDLAEQLKAKGINIQDISVGSTPTSEFAGAVSGITEIRPGTYIFYDVMQESYGSCCLDECAASVFVTIVSKPSKELAIIDGGSKTFATDVQPNQPPLFLKGFGKVVGYPNVTLERLNEEHGMLKIEGEADLQIGDTVEIIPNHICSTINLHSDVIMSSEDGRNERYTVSARGQLK